MKKEMKSTRESLDSELDMLVMVIENSRKHRDKEHRARIYSQYMRYAMDEFVNVNFHQSDEAKGKKRKDVIRDHVVPHIELMKKLFAIDKLSKDSVWEVIEKYYIICSITKEEDKRLNEADLKSKMPKDWCENEESLFARYEKVGIKYSQCVSS